jgi:hypothetical protein
MIGHSRKIFFKSQFIGHQIFIKKFKAQKNVALYYYIKVYLNFLNS